MDGTDLYNQKVEHYQTIKELEAFAGYNEIWSIIDNHGHRVFVTGTCAFTGMALAGLGAAAVAVANLPLIVILGLVTALSWYGTVHHFRRLYADSCGRFAIKSDIGRRFLRKQLPECRRLQDKVIALSSSLTAFSIGYDAIKPDLREETMQCLKSKHDEIEEEIATLLTIIRSVGDEEAEKRFLGFKEKCRQLKWLEDDFCKPFRHDNAEFTYENVPFQVVAELRAEVEEAQQTYGFPAKFMPKRPKGMDALPTASLTTQGGDA